MNTEKLDVRRRSIITIAAFTASGDLEQLGPALNQGLDAGLTINEINEILVQMYAYAGFPRSLNGLFTFMGVLDERKARGVRDAKGEDASPIPSDLDRDAYGAMVRARLAGLESDISGADWQLFSPVMDTFLKEHLFADIFARDVLTHQERELATIAALANMSGTGGQLMFHLGAAMNSGMTGEQLNGFIEVLETKVDEKRAESAKEVLKEMLARRRQPDTSSDNNAARKGVKTMSGNSDTDVFGRGAENTAYAKYFAGQSWLNILNTEGLVVANVTFEPKCRNNWHVHQADKGGGQILLCTSGRGWYQEWEKPARALEQGDVVHIPAGVKHWHGAARDGWFTHLAIEVPGENPGNEWLEPVSDDDYAALE